MADNTHNKSESRTSWREQFDSIKEVLDAICYEVVQNHEDGDIQDTVDIGKILTKADANYNTFLVNNGYHRLEQYTGVEKVDNKKQIRLNPLKWLKNRKLGESNQYYIEEIY